MAFNFPNTPSVNDEYTYSGKTWVWDGIAWSIKDDSAAALFGLLGMVQNTVVTSDTSATLIDSFDSSLIRSVSYDVQVSSPNGFHTFKFRALHDGNSVDSVQYADLYIGASECDFSTQWNNGIIEIYATPVNANTEISFIRTNLSNTGSYIQTVFGDINDGTAVTDLMAGYGAIDLNA